MKSLLLSTSSLWNCGDDLIREGVLQLLNLRSDVRQLWWNRGFGISDNYANDLSVNLPLTDYFLVAGTPRWLFNNERIYRHCLAKGIPLSIIGVGTAEFVGQSSYDLMKKVAQSGLCEAVWVRDAHARDKLTELGFKDVRTMLDPCFFVRPENTPPGDLSVVGWRKQYWLDGDPKLVARFPWLVVKTAMKRKLLASREGQQRRDQYDDLLLDAFERLPNPKVVTVHDNREVAEAEKLFGRENVYYASDYRLFFELYSRVRTYIGSRIHGAIPCLLHGAGVNIVYSTPKVGVINTAMHIVGEADPDLKNLADVTTLGAERVSSLKFPEAFAREKLATVVASERNRVRTELLALPGLGAMMKPSP